MSRPIEDYGVIGNGVTGALVATDGSIDWFCPPRFDSDACFAALLGTAENGYWQIVPADPDCTVRRRYRSGTAVLETTFETRDGTVTLIDFMPFTDDEHHSELVRIVRGDRGRVRMRTRITIRFDYGREIPWVRARDYGISAIAGADGLELHTPVELCGEGFCTVADFSVGERAAVPFTLVYHPSHKPAERTGGHATLLKDTTDRWHEWVKHRRFPAAGRAHWDEAVSRSLVALKSMIFSPSGGIVAAPTTSLPEYPGGERNWDYRFCWIRDAALTLYSLLICGYREEARDWRHWLLRAAAGDPRQLQIVYGLRGQRRLDELELSWLPGYEDSRPVRVGNAAYEQTQLDVPGELIDTLHVARNFQLESDDHAWRLQRTIVSKLEDDWRNRDQGVWEIRGEPRHITHSKLMCWVAFDRAVKAIENFGLSGPVERWRAVRDEVRADICQHAWNEEKGAFVQNYGGSALDASLLLMAEMGFLSEDDPRFRSTVEAIERELMVDGLVLRYRPEETPDGLEGEEGMFLACSFWLVDAYLVLDRYDDAVALFEHLLSLRNDLGLLAEEYAPKLGRQVGNFPQAFSHIALINTAHNLAAAADAIGEEPFEAGLRERRSATGASRD